MARKRKRLSRRVKHGITAAATLLGLLGPVACAYGNGDSRYCSTSHDCRSRYGADWYCDHFDGGSTSGICREGQNLDAAGNYSP
jgi:hypothetical protein